MKLFVELRPVDPEYFIRLCEMVEQMSQQPRYRPTQWVILDHRSRNWFLTRSVGRCRRAQHIVLGKVSIRPHRPREVWFRGVLWTGLVDEITEAFASRGWTAHFAGIDR
jgi:hypothetical protein